MSNMLRKGFLNNEDWRQRDDVIPGGGCKHRMFRTRKLGDFYCEKCSGLQRRFAFQCPGCNMIACTKCRDSLKAGNRTDG